MEIKDIKTNRYLLRKVIKEDAEEIFEILSNPKVIENLNMNLHTKIEDTEKLLEDYFVGVEAGNKCPYAIIDLETNMYVGVFLLKLDLYNEDAFEFTIYLKEKFWGRGIYKEILPYMVRVAFEDIKTKNFRGYVMEKNIASRKVLEKSNFKLEKVFNVPNIDEKIYSFLITEEQYKAFK